MSTATPKRTHRSSTPVQHLAPATQPFRGTRTRIVRQCQRSSAVVDMYTGDTGNMHNILYAAVTDCSIRSPVHRYRTNPRLHRIRRLCAELTAVINMTSETCNTPGILYTLASLLPTPFLTSVDGCRVAGEDDAFDVENRVVHADGS